MKSTSINIGILAHVDAGKTTLSESMLYEAGSIRKLGRVDNRDTFFDTNKMERLRGITIFSKQASFSWGEKNFTLLDTPGHVDFSAEMERTLQVLDYAILVVSGADGIQSHTLTLWRLLKYYNIPIFIFVNKMDQGEADKVWLLQELQRRLGEHCIDFSQKNRDTLLDQVAMCQEELMEEYLETSDLEEVSIAAAVASREIFPCYFGSALKMDGVVEFLEGFSKYTGYRQYPEEFGAKVYKITREPNGTRLTHLKVTGGTLKVKALVSEDESEKIDQIRIYGGEQFKLVSEASAGAICTVTGLVKTKSGQGLGSEQASEMPLLEPVLTYQILLPESSDAYGMFRRLKELEEEFPQLHIVWKEEVKEIHAQLMGEIEIEILKALIEERYKIEVSFGNGSILYRETIKETVYGVGHFEPLRHYAEVCLKLEPLEQGSGLQFETNCSEDLLSRNWQRLILTHLEEKSHRGVLTGSDITDMKIILIKGRAHLKHTEGGDFRQATYRAVRQGLKKAKSQLLEPFYEYRLEIPTKMVGRAMTDIQNMQGSIQGPELLGDTSILTGVAPVETMSGYQMEVLAYTQGEGQLICNLCGYGLCHNEEEIIEIRGYDSESDLSNPTGSVFCAHGAGFTVPWDEVENHMHLELEGISKTIKVGEENRLEKRGGQVTDVIDQEEIEEIFARTYGTIKRERNPFNYKKKQVDFGIPSATGKTVKKEAPKEKYLLVDGYNIIFAWKELKELAKVNMDGARDRLMDLMCNYQGYRKCHLILVFDAYKVSGNLGSVLDYHNIHVIYTKEAETADQYIEKVVHKIGQKYDVTVATSDRLEQMIIYGEGAMYLSAERFEEEVEAVNRELREQYLEKEKDIYDRIPTRSRKEY